MMRPKEFDPRKFIDREFEQELFEELLKRNDEARILSIADDGGMGKSHLLYRFQYRCRIVKPRIPVCLIALDQLDENSPLAMTQEIVEALKAFSISFPRFEQLELARDACDFTMIRGNVELSNADLSYVQHTDVAGIMTKAETIERVDIRSGPASLTPEQQAKAQSLSVQAFFDDLKEHCDQQPVVIMLDAFERCEPTLKHWITEHLLGRYCFDFDHRPEHLIVVVAGRSSPDFELYWATDDCDAIVKSVKSLSRWEAKHVEECLRVHGFRYTPQDLEAFVKMIEIGLPPSQVVLGMKTKYTGSTRNSYGH